MYGRMMNNHLGYAHFWTTIVSMYGVFFPMHFLGLAGIPRRYYDNTAFPIFDGLQDVNELISIFAILGAIAQVIFFFNFFYSVYRGPRASQNPWHSNSLEWTTPVEPIHGNWPGAIPTVYRWAYDYSRPDKDVDFIPQNVPPTEGEKEIH
jgi:cytochrome c oxidase subunit 1